MYARRGFVPIEPGSGAMTWTRESPEAFEERYFARGAATIRPLDWRHWPSAHPLFTGAFPGVVRAWNLKLLGRRNPEGALLPAIRAERARPSTEALPQAAALQREENGATVGVAVWQPHPGWAGVGQLDLWCHPQWWDRAEELAAAVGLAQRGRTLAYVDAEAPARQAAYARLGFAQVGTLPQLLPADLAGTRRCDVHVFDRR